MTELLDQSAPRVELDQRSREARLRLEQFERLLVESRLPRESLLRRVAYCFRPRVDVGNQVEGQSADTTLSGTYSSLGLRTAGGTISGAPRSPVGRPAAWQYCANGRRTDLVLIGAPAFKPWQPRCSRIP